MHVMVIPDGDRRYAKKMGIAKEEAYKRASLVLRNLIEWILIDNGVQEFTFFGLSNANISKRDSEDLKPIIEAQIIALNRFSEDEFFNRNGISVRIFGKTEILPLKYRQVISKLESATGEYKGGKCVNLLIGYSGMDDLEQAVQKACAKNTPATIKDILDNSLLKTPIDLIIRCANERRLSDGPCLLTAYSEMYFVDSYFPELKKDEIDNILKEYTRKERTFGK